MIKKYIIIVMSAFILAFVVTGCSSETNAWDLKVQEIVFNEQEVQAKFNTLEAYEHEYTATIAELERFYAALTANFESGEYLKATDEEEVLTNYFKAIVLANQASGGPQQFAVKYLENVKYTYIGVVEPTSDLVLANEKLMAAVLKNAL